MKILKHFFLPLLVGVCVTLLVAAFMDDGLLFMFLSIVCTAGISLVAWIPVWWIVGFVIVSIISLFTKSPAKPDPRTKPDPPVDPHQSVLTRYIRSELAIGRWNREQIDERLRHNGWSDEAIQEAHRAVSAQGS